MNQVQVRKNAYYDSVTLMLITREVKSLEGVSDALVGMGTDLNKQLVTNLGLEFDQMEELTPNDFFIVAKVDKPETMEAVIQSVEDQLTRKQTAAAGEYRPVTLSSALEHNKNLNLAQISVAGQYAKDEAMQALDKGMHVMLFSDNVPVEAEKALKEKAVEKGLLMMGPDCGTAIINGVALCFANVVKRGSIGVVGASGTGTQEITVLIDQMGGGLSQVIGTGGRDLSEDIGGLMMLQGFQSLIEDPATKVIVLISKPPAPTVAKKILDLVKATDKPVVVDFIGGDPQAILDVGAYPCSSLEDAAQKAVALEKGETPVDFQGFTMAEEEIEKLVKDLVARLKDDQVYLRALYTGGTLADEAMKILGEDLAIYSNIPLSKEYDLKNLETTDAHICFDLGEDQFTQGRPHPMIDPMTREEYIQSHVDAKTALLLADVVLGYGSHADPAGEFARVLKGKQEELRKEGKELVVIASVTGTDKDPQDYQASLKSLEEVGAVVMPSNYQAALLTKRVMKELQ